MSDGIILNKYISNLGLYSRKEADELIKTDRVRINGKLAKPGARLVEGDKVSIDGEEVGSMVKKQKKKTYILFHKPYGIVCSTNKTARNNIIGFIGHERNIVHISKLVKESEGLIILSDDNQINKQKREKILKLEQEYIVNLNHKVTREFTNALEKGIHHKRRKFPRAKVKRLSKTSINVCIRSADDKTVKLMCGTQGFRVKAICKIRIGHIKLGRLKSGKWRNLNAVELQSLEAIIS